MPRPRRTPRTSLASVLLAAAVGCSDAVEPVVVEPPTGPVSRDELVGTFDAVGLSVVMGQDTTDLLAAGASLEVTLQASAQYAGHVTAPGIGPGGADLDEALDGAWTFDVVTRTVRFPSGSSVLDTGFRPSRSEDLSTILLAGSVAADQFLGTPAIEIVLERR